MATLRRQVKNMVKNYSEAEVKVREATSNDPWGPSSTLMSEISDLTYNITAFGEVMRMIWKRVNDHGKNWRHVYKSLVLLDYLIKNGNEKVAQQCKEHIVQIQTLKDFQYIEEQKDQGLSVREKSKQLVNLLRDDERLKQERTKAFKARERFAQNAMGISSDNKLTYATSNQNRSANYGRPSGGSSYTDPYGGAVGVPDPLGPDLEAVRPSDPNEEDLQIKLAIMLSQQEHDEETQRKRADDAKLALALEQSKSEGQPNGLVDLGDFGSTTTDPWGNNNNQQNHFASNKFSNKNDDLDSGDEFFPPLFNNPNQTKKPAMSEDPWANNSNQIPQLTTNPWQPQPHQPQASAVDPWAVPSISQQKADDFDLFTSDRAVNQSPQMASNANNSNPDPFGDFFGSVNQNSSNSSTNPWNSAEKTNGRSAQPVTAVSQFSQQASARKTPESFLGENSSLVNLENLIPARPKSTNPFGTSNSPMTLSTSNSSGQLSNPFLAQQALQNQNKPTISQLQSQQRQQQVGAFPSFGNNTNGQYGQLPQPLIPPSNSIPSLQPLSFNSNGMKSTPPGQTNMANFNSFNNVFNNNNNNNNSGGQTAASGNPTNNPFLMM